MSVDPRLTYSIRSVVFEVRNHSYLTDKGFKEYAWVWRTVRWLLSWTGLVESTTQVCAQKTFDQIVAAYKSNEDPGTLRGRCLLLSTLYEGKVDLSSLRPAADKACRTFECFLVEELGFHSTELTPPPKQEGESEHVSFAVSAISDAQSAAAAASTNPDVLVFRASWPLSDDSGDPKDGNLIRTMITTIHETPIRLIWKEKPKIDAMRAQLQHLHTLRYLSFILADPELRRRIREFKTQSDSLKWGPFKGNLDASLRKKESTTNYLLYLEGFAASIGVHPQEIEPFFRAKRWAQMIEFLVQERLR